MGLELRKKICQLVCDLAQIKEGPYWTPEKILIHGGLKI